MDPSAPSSTRRSLHAVAELLLAGPQFRASETIRLQVRPGGFGTVAAPAVRVDGTELVTAGGRFALAGSSCADLAAAAGLDLGAPAGLYGEGCDVGPEEVLHLDPATTAAILDGFAAGDAALRRFAPDRQPVLWPEHFDLGITVDEVNYGVSPGDAQLPEPYAYVGPWARREGAFWNVPFGAARPLADLTHADALAGFFATGRARAQADPPAADD
ncbi:hypothetical protein ACFW1A_15500 [Kitasatospora sp. NPDC058965]|uniref:hypothetical protein n=1 Tax=Kitasatospora sp. NPDC058965 TaxID=3346682 RepID=UPI00367ADFC3